MPLELRVTPLRPEISTHESLTVECRLLNTGTAPVEIPGQFDRSGALNILLRDAAGLPLRSMNRQTRQRMLSDGRVDATLDLDVIAPGEEWPWRIDLASFHYLFPASQFALSGRLDYGIGIQSADSLVSVREDPIRSVQMVRDNPILDSVSLLIGADSPAGLAYYLRQHNYDRPSGAWYAARIPTPPDAGEPFFATAGYYQAESFDPAFSKWIVTQRGASALEAYCFVNGVPTARRKAQLPHGAALVRSAFHSLSGDVFIFLWASTGLLECHRLDATGLTKMFEHDPRVPAGTPISIGAFRDAIHLAIPRRGIVYERLNLTGALLDRVHAFRTPYRPVQVVYEPGVHRIRAVFTDARRSQSVHAVAIDLQRESIGSYLWERFPVRERRTLPDGRGSVAGGSVAGGSVAAAAGLRELSFDQDEGGRFHLLASTADKRLYYLSETRGPILVADGEADYYPVVCAPRKVYLGFNRRSIGFRFVQYQRRRQGGKFAGMDPHPSLD